MRDWTRIKGQNIYVELIELQATMEVNGSIYVGSGMGGEPYARLSEVWGRDVIDRNKGI